jgi:cob(I)alamin adenosyltransferase
MPGAFLHLARTVCRRAERIIVTLRETDDAVSAQVVHYVNRLSDALFVWARWANVMLGAPECLWSADSQPPGVQPET